MRAPLSALLTLLACTGALAASPEAATSTIASNPDGSDAAASPSSDTPPDHASPSVCVVILGLQQQAVSDKRAAGDVATLASVAEGYRAKAGVIYDGDGGKADAKIKSLIPSYDGLTAEQLARAADMCLVASGKEFSADE